jgi:hypothetical protein
MGSRILIHNLGYPRLGAHRQLKKSLEAYSSDAGTEADLQSTASDLRRTHWLQQREAGFDRISSNDFSFYDHVLDTAAMVGAVPERFKWKEPSLDLSTVRRLLLLMVRRRVGRPQARSFHRSPAPRIARYKEIDPVSVGITEVSSTCTNPASFTSSGRIPSALDWVFS